MYKDSTFRATVPFSNTIYANGGAETTSDNRDVIFVTLGGIDNSDIDDISGGWSRVFQLARPNDITILISFQLQVSKTFATSEISEVLCSLDGDLLRNGSDEFLAQLSGNENSRMLQQDSSRFKFVGFKDVILSAKNVTAGNHTLVVGGHLTRKTFNDEVTIIRFDEVQVYALDSANRPIITGRTKTKGRLRRI